MKKALTCSRLLSLTMYRWDLELLVWDGEKRMASSWLHKGNSPLNLKTWQGWRCCHYLGKAMPSGHSRRKDQKKLKHPIAASKTSDNLWPSCDFLMRVMAVEVATWRRPSSILVLVVCAKLSKGWPEPLRVPSGHFNRERSSIRVGPALPWLQWRILLASWSLIPIHSFDICPNSHLEWSHSVMKPYLYKPTSLKRASFVVSVQTFPYPSSSPHCCMAREAHFVNHHSSVISEVAKVMGDMISPGIRVDWLHRLIRRIKEQECQELV